MDRKYALTKRIRLKIFLALVVVFCFAPAGFVLQTKAEFQDLEITTNFADREITSGEGIELKLSRDLRTNEGRFAVFLNETDLTGLFLVEPQTLSYKPKFVPFPIGENELTVYLVNPNDEWRKLAEFSLKVKAETNTDSVPTAPTTVTSPTPSTTFPEAKPEETPNPPREKWKMEFTPNLSLNLKGQNQTLTFPREAAPERNPYTDLAGQGTINLKITRNGWSLLNQFNFAGSSFQPEALRFSELGTRAPRIDLSSYQITLEKGRFKLNLGHLSFGSNRHLINSFSSRGITVTIPIGQQNEISLAAMNGTSIVGFDNFVGFTRRNHQVLSLTLAREFFKERPGGLRFEFSVMSGSLLPLNNFNQGEVNDAEKSLGFGLKVIGSDTAQRLRYEAGFTRSHFTNPADAQLTQGFDLTEIRPATRHARYAEISFDFLQGLKLWKEKKLKLTGTFRHEEIEPLFRSIGVSTQADQNQNQFEVAASFGEINFVYGNLRDRNNLDNLASILKTFTRRHNAVFSIALNSFFTPNQPIRWLPQVSYSSNYTHQFGTFLPNSGLFDSLSQVPDQDSFNRSFNAQWQLSEKLGIGYRFNRTFQDNKQPGREKADFGSEVNAVSLTTKPFDSLSLDFELSRERLKNFEQPRIDQTFRFGTRATWQTPFLKDSAFNAGLSTTIAGDTQNFSDSRNLEFDMQWTYKFSVGKEKFKKVETQFFIRYANRYGDRFDRQFFINSFNKTQTFNAGLTFNIF